MAITPTERQVLINAHKDNASFMWTKTKQKVKAGIKLNDLDLLTEANETAESCCRYLERVYELSFG